MTDLLLNAARRIRELEAERDAARKLADRLAAENARLREANDALTKLPD